MKLRLIGEMRDLIWRAALAAGLSVALWAQAGAPLTGVVQDATIGKPVAGVPVVIMLPGQEGMRPAAQTKTDAQGQFRLTIPASSQTVLLAAHFQGVDYYQPIQAGQAEAQLQVYEATSNTRGLRVHELATVLQPEHGQLAVVDEYMINNQLSPPRTWNRSGGIFKFRIPAGIKADGAQVIGPDGMTVQRTVVPTRQKNVYTLNYPLRPGQTRVQVSYRLPYNPAQANVNLSTLYPVGNLQVYVPPPMRFLSAKFSQLGTEDGYQVFSLANPPGNLNMRVEGNAPLPQAMQSAANGAGTAGSANDDQTAAQAAGTVVIPRPNFIEQNFWTLLAGLILMAAAMLIFKLRQPDVLPAAPAGSVAFPPAPVAPPPAKTAAPPAAEAEDEMQRLKNDLFLLEVRRHTGNISAAEYEAERARLEARTHKLLEKTVS